MFRDVKICHLTHTFSEHCSLLISTEDNLCGQVPTTLKFEAWWLLKDTLEEEIRKS